MYKLIIAFLFISSVSFGQVQIELHNEEGTVEAYVINPGTLKSLLSVIDNSIIEDSKKAALQNLSAGTIKGRYSESDLLRCAIDLGLIPKETTTKQTTKNQLAGLLINHFK